MIKIEMPDIYLQVNNLEEVKMLKDFLKDVGGVYFIYGEGNELLYVGKTKSFYDRILVYFNENNAYIQNFDEKIERIDFYQVKNPYEREIYETYAINEYSPIYNLDKNYNLTVNYNDGYFEADEEIRVLREEKEELEEELKSLVETEKRKFINMENVDGFKIPEFLIEKNVSYKEIEDEDGELNSADLGRCLQIENRIEELNEQIYELQRDKSVYGKYID